MLWVSTSSLFWLRKYFLHDYLSDLRIKKVESWLNPNTGFEALLKSREGRRLFEEFLKKEFSSENIQFWSAVEQLKSLQGGEKMFRQHVDVIFKIYINDTALAEVSWRKWNIIHIISQCTLRLASTQRWSETWCGRKTTHPGTSSRRLKQRYFLSCTGTHTPGMIIFSMYVICALFRNSKSFSFQVPQLPHLQRCFRRIRFPLIININFVIVIIWRRLWRY